MAIIPFEKIEPKWKVIRISGQSPLEKTFDMGTYPLSIPIGWSGKDDVKDLISKNQEVSVLPSNRDPKKLTVAILTGTTAMIRATGARMEENGMTYPGIDIQNWLRDADITHISNEASFDPNCAHADFQKETEIFCSRPEYLELLSFVGTDIVELTGNHLMDYGWKALNYSIDLYTQNNIKYYGGGKNTEDSQKVLKIEHNGNKLAFIGCNAAGPNYVWATETQPGAAECDLTKIGKEIDTLTRDGYLPIVTFQHFESYGFLPGIEQKQDFETISKAGAVIVSGSQAHFPQIMQFTDDNSFIHYGLGNLFFDQMDFPVPGTRREFIDRHVFYNGKYINTELLTAMLEDYSRPRPMYVEERANLLKDIFEAGTWE